MERRSRSRGRSTVESSPSPLRRSSRSPARYRKNANKNNDNDSTGDDMDMELKISKKTLITSTTTTTTTTNNTDISPSPSPVDLVEYTKAKSPSASPSRTRKRRLSGVERQSAYAEMASHAKDVFRSDLYTEKPRQVLFLIIGVGLLIVYGIFRVKPDSNDPYAVLKANVHAGLLAIMLTFALYSALQMRDFLMVRPHPMVWRIVHGVGVLYLLALAMLFVQPLETARACVALVAPGNISSTESPFSDEVNLNCKIGLEALEGQVKSPWFTSHLLGWMCKMILFRDFTFVLLSSLFFEFEEMSLQFLIPEFKECWWDSLFVDFLGANMVGIFVGHQINRFLKLGKFQWLDEEWDESTPTRKTVASKTFDIFMPFVWFEYRWQFFSTPRRLGVACFFMVMQLLFDVNAFFLLHIFYIPVSNKLNHLRLALFMFLAIPAVTESYAFLNLKTQRLGPNAWLCLAMIVLEFLIIIKFAREVPSMCQYPPMDVVVPWLLFISFFILWAVFYYRSKAHGWLKRPQRVCGFTVTRDTALRYMLLLVFSPLALLTRNWDWNY